MRRPARRPADPVTDLDPAVEAIDRFLHDPRGTVNQTATLPGITVRWKWAGGRDRRWLVIAYCQSEADAGLLAGLYQESGYKSWRRQREAVIVP